MKVVMICEFYDESLDYQEILLAKYYKKLGCDVTVITSLTKSVHDYIAGRDARGGVEIEQGAFAKIVRVPVRVNIAGRIRIFSSLRNVVEAEHPDLLYFHDIIPNMVELRGYIRRHRECCVIMDYHADYSNSGANALSRLLLHRLSRRPILASVIDGLAAILPVVPAAQPFLRDLYGIQPERTELFPLGVDVDMASKFRGHGIRTAVRRLLSIPDDALVIFTGGKLVPAKRTEQVLEAVQLVSDRRLHVIIVGEARDEIDYRDRLLAAGAGINAHFVGWQDREGVYRHQAASDVAIFPASQSVLWQQSIGMGLPLVVGEGSGPAHRRQEVGYMNLADNIHILDGNREAMPQIAAFLRRGLGDGKLFARMAAGADEVTRTYLSYERLAQRTLDIAAAHRRKFDKEIEHA